MADDAPRLLDILASIRTVSREHGYAVAVHGSLSRDVDLVAIPWGEVVAAPHELVAAIVTATGWLLPDPAPTPRSHGRLCWVLRIPTMITTAYIDLSVMQPHECYSCYRRPAT